LDKTLLYNRLYTRGGEGLEKGFVHVYYGDGKGKTTSAIGFGIRALGNNDKVIMIQFLKKSKLGESETLRNLEPYFKVFDFEKKHGMIEELNDEEKEELKSATKNAFNFASKVMDTGECDVLILDEILNAVEQELIKETDLCDLIDSKSENMEVILTGRMLSENIAKRADYISYVKAIKHPGKEG
jgi:cob(I)alamin adenosyltransferase